MKSLLLGLFFFSISVIAQVPNLAPRGGDGKKEEREILGSVTTPSTQKKIKLEFPVDKLTLPNGMVFLLHYQPTVPMISYHTWFRVGAKDELPGESGLAHMFEHMMFKGTQKYPHKEFDRIMEANGIINNAFTNQDYTGYYEILPSSKLELIMDMESDRLQTLKFEQEEFQREREVVKEERRMRVENNPEGKAWEKLNELVFQGNKYGLPVIGSMAEINGFTIEKLKKFYKKWYMPSNAVVVIVGDFDKEKIKDRIIHYYGDIKSPSRPQRNSLAPTSQLEKKESQISIPVQSSELFLGTATVRSGSEEAFSLDLLGSILGQGKSSRLHQELVYKQQKALMATSGHYTLQDSGMMYLQIVGKPGVDLKELKSAMNSEIQRFLKEPSKEEELTKAKNMILSEYVEALKTNDGKAKILAMNEIMYGDYKEFFRDMDRYIKVTVEDLNRVKKFIDPEKMIHVTVSPSVGGKK